MLCYGWLPFQWRPQLNAPNDEMVLDAAVNDNADALVTFNRVHFATAATRFSLPLWLPECGSIKAPPL